MCYVSICYVFFFNTAHSPFIADYTRVVAHVILIHVKLIHCGRLYMPIIKLILFDMQITETNLGKMTVCKLLLKRVNNLIMKVHIW